MRESRDGITCDFVFAKSTAEAMESFRMTVDPTAVIVPLINPLPTGDHWKVLSWVIEYRKKGASMLTRVPSGRRDFIKKASLAFDASHGFCMEISSQAARKFRDDSGLRMQRGKVYVVMRMIAEG